MNKLGLIKSGMMPAVVVFMLNEIENRQIVALANQGASAREIAVELGIEEAGVRLVLNALKAGEAADRDINDEQLTRLRANAFRLAVSADDENVQARLTMFLIERDKPSDRQNGSSITAINKAIIVANQDFQKLAESFQNA